ncbi:MAG: methyltransferase [Candidatus Hinthialibacter antarcticus]|nr:methyltransferase [Candidatus Hinthialibacter antarcticus]
MNPAPDFDRLRPNIESQRLAEFVKVEPGQTVVDLGCGGGYIAMRLAHRFPQVLGILGFDIQKDAAQQASAAHQKFLQEQCGFAPLQWLIADATQAPLRRRSVDVIVCNPPFFSGTASRPSPDAARRIARRDDTLTAEQIVAFADWALKPTGSLYWVWPASMQKKTNAAAKRFCFTTAERCVLSDIRKRDGGVGLVRLRRSTPI